MDFDNSQQVSQSSNHLKPVFEPWTHEVRHSLNSKFFNRNSKRNKERINSIQSSPERSS